jgi:SAM-dependent methyltransferase
MNKVESYFATKGAWSKAGVIELACTLVPDWGKGRHLDLGCGVGKLLSHARGHRDTRAAVGMDLTYKMLHLGKLRFGIKDALVQGDAVTLPFKNACFDVVTCTETLEIVSDLEACLSEIARVVTPGGWFVLSMPTYSNLLWLDKRLGDHRLARTPTEIHGIEGMHVGWAPWGPEPTERAVSPLGMRRHLLRSGFRVHRSFTRDFFVTLDRSFMGRGLNSAFPKLWKRVERWGPSIDAAVDRLGKALPFARFLGYKLFCVCQRTDTPVALVRSTVASTRATPRYALSGRRRATPYGPDRRRPSVTHSLGWTHA